MTMEDLTALQRKVTLLRSEGKYKETIENCYDLLDIGMQVKDYKSILTAYLNLTASFYCVGDIESAFNVLAAYEETCDNYGDEIDKLNSYNVIFLLYDYIKDLTKAKNTLEKSIALGKELGKYNIVSNGYSNYSHVCMLEKNYVKALEMAAAGLEMAKLHEPASPILELRVKLNIARAHIYLKNFDTSKILIDEMINNPILDSYIREKAQCYDLQGHWYNSRKLHRQAFETFTQAKLLVESYNDLYLLKSIQEERCKLCELMGEINLGYEVQKEYITLLEEISEKELALTALKLEIELSIASLKRKANIDQLTGIYNRNYIETEANAWLKQAYKNNGSMVCIVFDIDNFKSINDTYGHLFGDEVIRLVSRTCLNVLGEEDLLGRFGGDEFIIILKDFSLESGKKKAEEILDLVRNLKFDRDGCPVPLTVSIGVTSNLSCKAVYFKDLFNAADMMLYKAKKKGKNQIHTSD